jgi:hypothetical protein
MAPYGVFRQFLNHVTVTVTVMIWLENRARHWSSTGVLVSSVAACGA